MSFRNVLLTTTRTFLPGQARIFTLKIITNSDVRKQNELKHENIEHERLIGLMLEK